MQYKEYVFFYPRHKNSEDLVKRSRVSERRDRKHTHVYIKRALSAYIESRGTVFPIAFVRDFHCLLLYRTPYESMYLRIRTDRCNGVSVLNAGMPGNQIHEKACSCIGADDGLCRANLISDTSRSHNVQAKRARA